MAELKPCPFCGGNAVVRKTPGFDGRFYVRCENIYGCHVIPTTTTWLSETGAVRAWNERKKPKNAIDVHNKLIGDDSFIY